MAETKKKSLNAKKRADRRTYILFLLPAVLAFTLVIMVPFIQGIIYSFTDWNGISKTFSFVGLTNYANAFKDTRFMYSARVTLIFGILNFVLVNIVAFLLALLVSSKLRGRDIYRAGFFLPNLIGGIVLGYIWQFIYNSVFPKLPLAWFQNNLMLVDPKLAVWALAITSTWQYAGYIMLIYYTALQNVPADLIESAQLDGANWWQRLTKIIMPLIAPTFTITLFLTLSNSFKQFDVVLSLTNGGPSMLWNNQAIKATELISVNIYNTASVQNQMALAQAKAVLFFIALAVISFIQTSMTRRKEMDS